MSPLSATNSRNFAGLPVRCFLLALLGPIATNGQIDMPPQTPLPPPPSPPPPFPPPLEAGSGSGESVKVATAGDDPTFIGTDGVAYHVCHRAQRIPTPIAAIGQSVAHAYAQPLSCFSSGAW